MKSKIVLSIMIVLMSALILVPVANVYACEFAVDIEKYVQPETLPEIWVCKIDKPQVLVMQYTGDNVLDHQQDPKKVKVLGADLAGNSPIHIVVTDKDKPFDSKAKIFFDGIVSLGETFGIDASLGGWARLKAHTVVHFFDLDGNWMRAVKFHTSCSQPLILGDKYGGVQLVGFVGEHGATAGITP